MTYRLPLAAAAPKLHLSEKSQYLSPCKKFFISGVGLGAG
jgi:hypothetical protein